ncbi:MAG: prenyltransferase/squalene oxidase repeat-containing protein [bacterium]
MNDFNALIDESIAKLSDMLIKKRTGHIWRGRLSSSALSTAVTISAFVIGGDTVDKSHIDTAVQWLIANQNNDGGWGDTPESISNISTTLLSLSALILSDNDSLPAAISAREYISKTIGNSNIPTHLSKFYGKDRTFAVPILMNCALAGLVDWHTIPALPFELAAVPGKLYKFLRLQVVSYALPALIAVGIILHHKNPVKCPKRFLRNWVIPKVREKLIAIQPVHGGYLDAAPLTAFTAMSMLSVFPDDPAGRLALNFLRQSMRPDGSLPIDTDLAIWATSGTINALATAGQPIENADELAAWYAENQYKTIHPFTGAEPDGWGWTDLPGAVPDADDTSGAIIALDKLGVSSPQAAGINWLLNLQNSDGGWPTFCRGWGQLPFDKSTPDITAHAIRALSLNPSPVTIAACKKGFNYLKSVQRTDGSWVPLWFGSQSVPGGHNPVFGTARVLLAYENMNNPQADKGEKYLLSAQNTDGGWGGDAGVISTNEETALAVIALAGRKNEECKQSALRGAKYLLAKIASGEITKSSPIGLYFASLWYDEELYPLIWSLEALGKVRGMS